MAQRINVVQYDNNIKLIFTIKKDGRIESLLGAEVHFQMIDKNSNTVLKKQCVITDASSAECMYALTSEDLAVPGGYLTELQIEYANGTKLSVQNPVIITVQPEIIPG